MKKFLRILIGIGLLVYLDRSGAINWSTLLNLAEAWKATIVSLLLLLLVVGLTSWRLCLLLKPRGFLLPLPSSIKLTLIGAFFNTFLPGTVGGDMVRIYHAVKDHSGQRTEITTLMLMDRASGILALTVLPLLAAPLFPRLFESSVLFYVLLWAVTIGASLMLISVILCTAGHLHNTRMVSRTFQILPLGIYVKRVLDTIYAYRHNKGTLLAVIGISLVVQSIMVGIMLLLVDVTSPTGASWTMTVLIPLGFLVNALPLTPGGLGVGEVAFDKLFALAGLTGGVEALLAWRVLTTLIDISGLVFFLQERQTYIDRYQAGEST